MIEHRNTESAEINFTKLTERIMGINNPKYGKANDMKELLYQLAVIDKPTLIMATGGSKVIAYYLQAILERIEGLGIICEVIEPRDFFYKTNKDKFSNLIVISASGNTNGIKEALTDFKGNKFLICENQQEADFQIINWGNDDYEKEYSFISLATSLGPMSLMLSAIESFNTELTNSKIRLINEKLRELLMKSEKKINRLSLNFKDTNLIQIVSGYDTRGSSVALESNLTEVGLSASVIHDKGSFCHGRSNLLFQYPNSKVIYLTHQQTELDETIISAIKSSYSNPLIFETQDLDENYFWKEYYLLLQMYFLSRKIADDKQIDLTQPEYNPQLVKRLYRFRGEM